MTTLRIFPIVHSPVRRTDAASLGGFDNRGVANPGKLFSCRAHYYPAVADRRKLPVLSRDSFRRNVAASIWANPAASVARTVPVKRTSREVADRKRVVEGKRVLVRV